MMITRFSNSAKVYLRSYSTKVAIVGSGPAGFYTAHHLMKKNENLKVDIFEKLPVPYGLSRYGVAPDHPEVKNCQDTFNELGNLDNFKFFGNVTVGKDISLQQLHDSYNCVVFSYGCDDDNIKDFKRVPGFTDSRGIMSARKFVGWYNGLPELREFDPPLEDAETVTIIGNGNVALDVARALLQPVDVWAKTDMTDYAVAKLAKSNVKHVRIVGRRGILENAFTNKELRELLELRKDGVIFNLLYPEDFKDVVPVGSKLDRTNKRRLDLISKAVKLNLDLDKNDIKKVWLLEYLKSLVKVTPSSTKPGLVESLTFVKNELVQDSPMGPVKCEATSKTFTYKTDLLITSTGYKGSLLDGFEDLDILFDHSRGTLGNVEGRLVSASDTSKILKGFYASGWIAIGAKGVIMSTMMNGFQTADLILADLPIYEDELKPGSEAVEAILKGNSVRFVTWDDWKKLEKFEFDTGAKKGKVRNKICDVDEMLKIL